MAAKLTYRLLAMVLTIALTAPMRQAVAAPERPFQDTAKYPISDRRGDPYTYGNRNAFDLRDTAFVSRYIEYDPVTKQYYVIEKIGSKYYRTPAPFSMQEFLRVQGRKDENEYFRQRANALSNLNRRNFKPRFDFSSDWVNRITGNGKVEIRPSGFVDLSAGYQGQFINNPTLPERARRNGGFDFNQNAQLQVDAKIGDKINLPINYNTLANFDFENQLKLDYQGKDDEILKQFQAGNVSFTSRGTLIPGAQSLFGVRTQLQFGKLYVTTVLANQRSQRQTANLQGGSATQQFSIRADEYEENRHFLLGQYFRNRYNEALNNLPQVKSNVNVLRVEVWVTNRLGIISDFQNATGYRDIVAFADMGESNPYRNDILVGTPDLLPRNNANDLLQKLSSNPSTRNSTEVQNALTAMTFQPVQDFEKTFARKLQPTDYIFQPQLGYISLNSPLQPDEVLGIAYQYTFNGKVYQVGEFSQDVPPDSTGNSQKVLFLKLLKATSQRTNLPIWDLMMKNVYSVGFGQLERNDFRLDITYEEPSLGDKRYLPVSVTRNPPVEPGTPLLKLTGLDTLNNQNDPQPDGIFDFLEGITVIASQSRIIFPVLEPFGRDLSYAVNPADSANVLFTPLYDTIKAIAQTYAQLNRFKLVGRSRSASNQDYQLGFNIPRGSVTVTAGGRVLQENIDYEINYDLGTLHVINQSVIQSGIPVQIQFENNATFGFQQRNYMGLRLDYLANKHLTIGGTVVRMSERPFFTKQGYGEDPIRNTMYGLDFDFRDDVPRLTKWLNRLPFYSTKAMSSISAYGEAAILDPGHAAQIGKGDEGVIYIDDFEGTKSSIDLRFPLIAWTLASVPQKSPDSSGVIRFPEADLVNDLASGYNRAKIAWYNIEPVLQERNNSNNPFQKDLAELSKPENRQVLSTEIFPQRTNDLGQNLLTTFDLSYYPKERGPYNFRTNNLDANGFLTTPKKSFGGLMRNIDQTDFESSNIEFIEFWLQDPFLNKPASAGGELVFNIGNISEDVLRDGKRQYENGLPTPTQPDLPIDSTEWGRIPRNPIQITNAFSNDPNDRPFQDVGFDGLSDSAERTKYAQFISAMGTLYGTTSPIYQQVLDDPSGDNFRAYRDPSFTGQPNDGILKRYKNINNPHGNSPVANEADEFTNAFTLYPDQEELNRDNTLNEVEEYFQYHVTMKPNMDQTNNKHITDVRRVNVRVADGSTREEKWYLFRIPVKNWDAKVGNISDLKSIRFIRMFLNNFEDTAVLRFAKLELVRNQWRRFTYKVDSTGIYKPLLTADPVKMDVLAVNLEENDRRDPIPYVQPPGIERQQQISNNNTNLLLNEQSISLRYNNLLANEARGVFKTMNLDLRQYGSLKMFIHAEDSRPPGNTIPDEKLEAIIRIGNDFVSNYYEVRIPLKITPWTPKTRDSTVIWPDSNYLDFDLDILTTLKMNRNLSNGPSSTYFDTVINGKKFAIFGNPNLGEVRGMFLGVENMRGGPENAEVWFNELRLSKLDESGGYAALGRVDIRLADLGSINLSGSFTSIGWGTLEQKVNERSRETRTMFDATANLDLGRLLPRSLGMQIPVFASFNKTVSTPEYDPYDLDIKLSRKLDAAPAGKKDSIRNDAVDELTSKTIGFTNLRKNRTGTKAPKPWDISNLDLNFVHTHTVRTNPIIERDDLKRTVAGVGYTYQPQPKFYEPLKGIIKSRSPWLALIRDFNFNLLPFVSVQAKVERQFNVIRNRNVGTSFKLPELFNKYWYFDRFYTLRWELTRSLILDFVAVNNARVDEPFGRLNSKEKQKTAWDNFWKGGRNTHYSHDATLSYTLPTAKIPLLDFAQANVSYTAKYDWIASSLLTKNLGNFLDIGQERNARLDLDFDRLYTKSRFLRGVYNDAPPPPKTATKDTTVKKKKRDPNEVPYISGVPKFLLRMATALKRVNVTYVENLGTMLPGYMDSTKVLGMNIGNGNPGWKYVMGYQPDTSDINELGRKGLLSRDSLFNALIQQQFNQTLNITAQVSPIRDLNIDLTWTKTFTKNYSEQYKDTTGSSGLSRLNPYATGSFSISYISYQTLFDEFDPNRVSETFKQFEANRVILSQRLKGVNPYAASNPNLPDGFVSGYGRYAQDVVIPAFLAAYTKKDPTTIGLIANDNPNVRSNPFRALIPKPNWNVIYSGLSRIPGLEKIFTNFTIRHGYNSTLSMNQFNSGLLFRDRFYFGQPEFIDTATGNYVPYYLIPNITISESFSPLIGVDVTLTNQMSFRFEYKKSRQLSLSLVDYQLAENQSTEYSFGFDWRKRGVLLFGKPKAGKDGKAFENDLTFRMDFSLRDDATANSKLDQNNAFGTAGQKVVRLAPSIDYVMNQRVNLKLYFEQNRIIPKIATSAPITNTRAGIQVRISLAQ